MDYIRRKCIHRLKKDKEEAKRKYEKIRASKEAHENYASKQASNLFLLPGPTNSKDF